MSPKTSAELNQVLGNCEEVCKKRSLSSVHLRNETNTVQNHPVSNSNPSIISSLKDKINLTCKKHLHSSVLHVVMWKPQLLLFITQLVDDLPLCF